MGKQSKRREKNLKLKTSVPLTIKIVQRLESCGWGNSKNGKHKKEHGFKFPNKTIGREFSPLRVTEHSSSDSDEGPSRSNE